MLDAYLKDLLKPETLQDNAELVIYMTRFLDHTSTYESERQSSVIKSATTSMKNSVKSAANVVTSVPSNIIHSVDYMVDGLSKVLTTGEKTVKAQCLKITQNVAFEFFEFWHFPPIFVLLKLTCLVTLFDRKLQVFKNSPKWTFFGIF